MDLATQQVITAQYLEMINPKVYHRLHKHSHS